MKISVIKGNITTIKTAAVIAVHFEDDNRLQGAAKLLDEACGGIISETISEGVFTGKRYETSIVETRGAIQPKRIILVGLGKRDECDLDRVRGAFSKGAQTVRTLRMTTCATSADLGTTPLPLDRIAQAAIEGALLGLYRFTPFKTADGDTPTELEEFTLVDGDAASAKIVRRGARTGEVISRAVSFARDLVAAPSNEMTPTILARKAREVAKDRNIAITVRGAAAMKKMKMNALIGVAQGSHEPPQLITMEYQGARTQQRPIVLIGKGITFDSGGISIKPAERMEEMKTDMSGGAAVIGTMMAVADLKLPVNIIGIIPTTENLPGGGAYKPGDVLRAMSGKTIEVINTDAEGRLVLADALTYAQRFKPRAMIDMATLTGACIIALGDFITGMMGTDEQLKDMIRNASRTTGETVWELPLYDDYNELLTSDIADVRNVGTRAGGAITAALFLKRFAGDVPWVHLDIAGPAWLAKDRPYTPKGASGVGVRLMVELLTNWTDKKRS